LTAAPHDTCNILTSHFYRACADMPCMMLPDAVTLAALCRVSLRQARRWRADPAIMPFTATVTVSLLFAGDLSVIGENWSGWSIDGDGFNCCRSPYRTTRRRAGGYRADTP